MTEIVTSIKKMVGTRVIKGKRVPHNIGKIREIVFFPDINSVAGFITKRSDFLFMFKRKGFFVSIKSYYMYEDYAFARPKKDSVNKKAYKALGLDPNDCVRWLGLPVITEEGEHVGVVTDVSFVHQNGDVRSIEASLGTLGKLVQGFRTIPIDMIIGYRKDVSLVLPSQDGDEEDKKRPHSAILVSPEALEIETEQSTVSKAGERVQGIARDANIGSDKATEKTASAIEVAGVVATKGAEATARQLKKTKGMFASFKGEYDKARHDDE